LLSDDDDDDSGVRGTTIGGLVRAADRSLSSGSGGKGKSKATTTLLLSDDDGDVLGKEIIEAPVKTKKVYHLVFFYTGRISLIGEFTGKDLKGGQG
jgi:hypothetical protein